MIYNLQTVSLFFHLLLLIWLKTASASYDNKDVHEDPPTSKKGPNVSGHSKILSQIKHRKLISFQLIIIRSCPIY